MVEEQKHVRSTGVSPSNKLIEVTDSSHKYYVSNDSVVICDDSDEEIPEESTAAQ